MKKIALFFLTAVLVFCAAGCQSNNEPVPEEVKNGKTQTVGSVSVLVPEGSGLTEGSIVEAGTSEKDGLQFYLKPEGNTSKYSYIWVVLQEKEEDCAYSCSVTKEVNDGEDLSFTTSNRVEWKGCRYSYESSSDGTIACGQVYAKSGDQIYLVSYADYEPDSAILKAVLNSLKTAE